MGGPGMWSSRSRTRIEVMPLEPKPVPGDVREQPFGHRSLPPRGRVEECDRNCVTVPRSARPAAIPDAWPIRVSGKTAAMATKARQAARGAPGSLSIGPATASASE